MRIVIPRLGIIAMAGVKRETELDVLRSVNSAKISKSKSKGFGMRVTDSASELAGTIVIKDSVAESDPEPQPASDPTPIPEAPATTQAAPVAAQPVQPAQPSIDVAALVQSTIQSVVAPLQEQLSQSQQKISDLESKLSTAQTELQTAQRDSKVLEDLAKLQGVSKQAMTSPNVNTQTKVDDSPKGLAAEFIQMLQDKEALKLNPMVRDGVTGMYLNQYDPSCLSRFVQASFREDRAKGREWRDGELIKSIEGWMKGQGFLSGKVTNAAGPTTGTTAPPFYLDVLSALMRETHQPTNIFWQFPIVAYDPSSAPGKTILVPRFLNLAEPTALSDYLIADNTTFNPIALTIGTGSDSQSLDVTSVPIGVAQYGLGRGTAIGTRPVFIPEFHEATSLISLLGAIDVRLMQNYYRFEDFMLRQEYLKATTIVFNDRGNITSTAADVAAGDNATMTKDFLNTVYSQMFAAQIPSLPDSCYVLVLNPTAANQLKISLDSMYAAPTPDQLQQALNTFRMAGGIEIGQLSGYMGQFCNFHCFVTNTIGVGAVNSVTVHTTTFAAGVGAQTTNDSFAFGMGAVGRGIASAVEIRNQASPFNLGDAFIWVSREGVTAMDVDSSSTAPSGQQTRVWRLRTARAAV